ncbi:MAG: hypothetical protein IJI14_16070 [Anaerolineaceae bacterium]|nr:hypothetical protein [Anaerolineaceae bacterium]
MAGARELTNFVLGVIIVFYSITVIFNLVKSGLSYMGGGPAGYAESLEKVVIMSILLAAAVIVSRMGSGSDLGIEFSGGTDGNSAIHAWQDMAKIVISVVVGTAYFFIAVRALWALFLGQAGQATGRPWMMSDALLKVGGVLVSGVLTVFAVNITQKLVDSIVSGMGF